MSPLIGNQYSIFRSLNTIRDDPHSALSSNHVISPLEKFAPSSPSIKCWLRYKTIENTVTSRV